MQIKTKKRLCIAGFIVAIALLVCSLFLTQPQLKSLSGVMLGIGSGGLSFCLSHLLALRKLENDPGLRRHNEIELKDERNTAIRNHAKAKSADITQWLVLGLAYLLILVDGPLWLTLTTVGVFLIYPVLQLVFTAQLQKEM